jgi:hypothetical protein
MIFWKKNLSKCPQVQITFRYGIMVNAILGSGSEGNLLTERIYEQIINAGLDVPSLPLGNIALTACGKRSKKIRIQALAEFTVRSDLRGSQ